MKFALVGNDIRVPFNVIDDGVHSTANIDLTTTRLDGYSTVPTLETVSGGDGMYVLVFSGVTPAPQQGTILKCKINGNLTGKPAWSTYMVDILMIEKAKPQLVIPAGYIGDFVEDISLLDFRFNTIGPSGTPVSLTSMTVTVLKDDETTQSAGISIDNDEPSPGINRIQIDTSSHVFYQPGHDYHVLATAGVVEGISVADVILASFSICNRSNIRLGQEHTHTNTKEGGANETQTEDVTIT